RHADRGLGRFDVGLGVAERGAFGQVERDGGRRRGVLVVDLGRAGAVGPLADRRQGHGGLGGQRHGRALRGAASGRGLGFVGGRAGVGVGLHAAGRRRGPERGGGGGLGEGRRASRLRTGGD